MFAEKKAIILDVRELHEWQAQHIAGAIHIPLAQVEARLSELSQYKDSPVIVQCRSGKRSAKAASRLQAAGFTQVYNLTGGIIAWTDDGLKTSQSKL
jgi:rhodanese-related sulfurtransferase